MIVEPAVKGLEVLVMAAELEVEVKEMIVLMPDASGRNNKSNGSLQSCPGIHKHSVNGTRIVATRGTRPFVEALN